MTRMQASRINADHKVTKKNPCHPRLKISVIRVLFFFGLPMTRMQAKRIEAIRVLFFFLER